jgi:hypothetical protein
MQKWLASRRCAKAFNVHPPCITRTAPVHRIVPPFVAVQAPARLRQCETLVVD